MRNGKSGIGKVGLLITAFLLNLTLGTEAVAEVIKTVPAMDASSIVDPLDFSSIRAVLLPQVDSTIKKVCGSDCPAFSILPVYKTGSLPSTGKLDDLGFDIAESSMTKTLSGIAIEVLTSDGLKPEVVQSIRNTVMAEARNYTELPVQVRSKAVASTVGIGEGKAIGAKEILDFAKTGIWPLAALLLGLVGLVGIGAYFHQKRKTKLHAYELENADKKVAPQAKEEMARQEVAAMALAVTEGRLEDLSRFLEECAYQKDFESLRKIVALFPGDTLSRSVQLAPVVPVMIAKAMMETGFSHITGTKQSVEWLKAQLDLVHWKRLQEKVEPMAKLSALTPEQLSQVFSRIPSAKGKALVLSFVESEIWPGLLSSLNSNQKVEVGGSLFQLQQVGVAADVTTRREVLDGMEQALAGSSHEKLLDEYVLYLSEEETRELSKNLASAPSFVRPKSVEQVLGSLSERQLLELVLGLDVDQIAVLVDKLPQETQTRVLAALPKKLKERIESRRQDENQDDQVMDSRWLQTRSRLMKLYNESHSSASSRSIH